MRQKQRPRKGRGERVDKLTTPQCHLVDCLFIHHLMQNHPSRMSPNTCIAHIYIHNSGHTSTLVNIWHAKITGVPRLCTAMIQSKQTGLPKSEIHTHTYQQTHRVKNFPASIKTLFCLPLFVNALALLVFFLNPVNTFTTSRPSLPLCASLLHNQPLNSSDGLLIVSLQIHCDGDSCRGVKWNVLY